jgi:hypothetical protein
VIAKIDFRNGGVPTQAGGSDEHIHRSVRREQQCNARVGTLALWARVLLLFGFVVGLGQIEGYASRLPKNQNPSCHLEIYFGNHSRTALRIRKITLATSVCLWSCLRARRIPEIFRRMRGSNHGPLPASTSSE